VKKRLWPWGCVIPGILIVLLLAGGAWWFLRSRLAPVKPSNESPVHVFLTSPVHGDESMWAIGCTCASRRSRLRPSNPRSCLLMVNPWCHGRLPGERLVELEAWPPGVHTLMGRARTVAVKAGLPNRDPQRAGWDGSLDVRAAGANPWRRSARTTALARRRWQEPIRSSGQPMPWRKANRQRPRTTTPTEPDPRAVVASQAWSSSPSTGISRSMRRSRSRIATIRRRRSVEQDSEESLHVL